MDASTRVESQVLVRCRLSSLCWNIGALEKP